MHNMGLKRPGLEYIAMDAYETVTGYQDTDSPDGLVFFVSSADHYQYIHDLVNYSQPFGPLVCASH